MNRCENFCAVLLALSVVLLPQLALAEIKPLEDAPKSFPPEVSKAKMRLPEGFRVDLIASEPLVEDPSGITFDEQGRMFVVGIHGYNREGHLDIVELNKTGELDEKVRRIRITGKLMEEADRQQTGSLRLLVDKDGDGRMDESIVWADDLKPAYGVIAAGGGIIVIASPDITYFADTNNDGKPDVREVLFTGFNRTLLERGNNCPRMGPDNWIYVGAGGDGGDITGPHLPKVAHLGHSDFRFKADGTAVEPVIGSVGTFGLAINDLGDRFPCSGGQPAIYALPMARRYLARNPNVPAPRTNHSSVNYNNVYRASEPHPWRVKRRSDPNWVKFYGSRETNSSYYTAGCGGEFYYGDLFPEQFDGHFFQCEPSQNIIHRCIVEPNGPGYRGHRAPGEEQKEFIASTDQWFRPINLRVGPDGALYICDMYREIIEDYSAIPRFLQQQYGLTEGDDAGRIWRLVPEDAPKYTPMTLLGVSPDKLVELLDNPNVWRRNTAQRLLIEGKHTSAAGALTKLSANGNSPIGRLLALRTLDALGKLAPATVLAALGDQDYRVRVHALTLSEPWLDSDRALLQKVVSMTNDANQRVRLQLAMTLGESSDSTAVAALLKLARDNGNQLWMSSAILSSSNRSAGAMLAALVGDGDLSEGAKAVLSPLAVTIAARRDGPQVAKALGSIVASDNAVKDACISGLIEGLSGREAPDANQLSQTALIKLLTTDSDALRAKTIRLAALLNLANIPEMKAAFTAAAKAALDGDRAVEKRTAAIGLLASAPYEIAAAAAEDLLDVRQPMEVQIATVKALASSDDQRVGATLLARWKSYTPTVQKEVILSVLERQNRLPALLDAIEEGSVSAGDVDANGRERLLKNRDKELARRAKGLFENRNASKELQDRIDLYTKALQGQPDLARGREIYTQVCSTCHRLGTEGHEVGPDLTEVANKPPEVIILELLDPSGQIQAEFRNYSIEMEDGKLINGLLASETATSVTLKQEKGLEVPVLRKDIASLHASDKSLMPDDLYKKVSPKDAANLIAYLRKAFQEAKPAENASAKK